MRRVLLAAIAVLACAGHAQGQAIITNSARMYSLTLTNAANISSTAVFPVDGSGWGRARGVSPLELSKVVVNNITWAGGLIGLTTGTVSFTSTPVFTAATASAITLSGGGTGVAWLASGALSSTNILGNVTAGTLTASALTLSGASTGFVFSTLGVLSTTTGLSGFLAAGDNIVITGSTVATSSNLVGNNLTFTGTLGITGAATFTGLLTGTNVTVSTLTTANLTLSGFATGVPYITSGVLSSTLSIPSLSIGTFLATTSISSPSYGGNLVTSLTLSGPHPSLVQNATTTGAIAITFTTNGSPQFANIGLNTAANTGTNLLASITTSTGIGMLITSNTTNYNNAYWGVKNSAGQYLMYFDGQATSSGGLTIRNDFAERLLQVGSSGTPYFAVYGVGGRSQVNISSGAILAFATAAETLTGSAGLRNAATATTGTSALLEVISGTTSGSASFRVSNMIGVGTTTANLSLTTLAGNGYFQGSLHLTTTASLTQGSMFMRAPNGVIWRTYVSDAGTLTTTTN